MGGILISVAKLVLTTLCAGVHPNRTLAVVLDCGTDNEDLLNDDIYLGLKQKRVRGKQYDEFVDTFVQSARKLYPRAYIHFEDFGLPNGTSRILGINLIHAKIFYSSKNPRSLQTRNPLFQRRRPRHWMRNTRGNDGRSARQ